MANAEWDQRAVEIRERFNAAELLGIVEALWSLQESASLTPDFDSYHRRHIALIQLEDRFEILIAQSEHAGMLSREVSFSTTSNALRLERTLTDASRRAHVLMVLINLQRGVRFGLALQAYPIHLDGIVELAKLLIRLPIARGIVQDIHVNWPVLLERFAARDLELMNEWRKSVGDYPLILLSNVFFVETRKAYLLHMRSVTEPDGARFLEAAEVCLQRLLTFATCDSGQRWSPREYLAIDPAGEDKLMALLRPLLLRGAEFSLPRQRTAKEGGSDRIFLYEAGPPARLVRPRGSETTFYVAFPDINFFTTANANADATDHAAAEADTIAFLHKRMHLVPNSNGVTIIRRRLDVVRSLRLDHDVGTIVAEVSASLSAESVALAIVKTAGLPPESATFISAILRVIVDRIRKR